MTRCAPGITMPATSGDGGVSTAQGAVNARSKYTAPVSRTARSTSERTSVLGVIYGRPAT